jgi:hypothetical protein
MACSYSATLAWNPTAVDSKVSVAFLSGDGQNGRQRVAGATGGYV